MDEPLKRILKAYDELGCDALELTALAERVRGQPDTTRAVLAQLVRRGWLRPAGKSDLYARTEDGRLAVAGPRDVTLYSRPGCHLCEQAKKEIVPLLHTYDAKLREVNIDNDPKLRERYTNDVPVIFLGSRKVAKHRVDLKQFRRQLEQAGR